MKSMSIFGKHDDENLCLNSSSTLGKHSPYICLQSLLTESGFLSTKANWILQNRSLECHVLASRLTTSHNLKKGHSTASNDIGVSGKIV